MKYKNNWNEEQVCNSIQDHYLEIIWDIAHGDNPDALQNLVNNGEDALVVLCRYIVQQEQELDRRLSANNDILKSFGDKIQEMRKAYHQ